MFGWNKIKKSVVKSKSPALISEELPVNKALTDQMLVDVVVNDDPRVWVFHDKPFPGLLEWAEYDAEEGSLVFVTKDGHLNDLGIKIKPLMHSQLEKAEYIEAYLVQNKIIEDYTRVSLLVRGQLN